MMENGRFTSPYTPNTDDDRQRMLDAIGVRSFDDLVADIPAEHRNPPIDLPPPTSELELRREIGAMAEQNAVPGDYACFLGAGSYRHFIPAIVRSVATRSEFMTAYTPYQPEVSQGTLQAHYEFQSLVCQLTGMEVANAGMYDGATSMAEAALMAARVTKRDRVAVLDTVSPAYRQVLETFLDSQGIAIDTCSPGSVQVGAETACLLVQQPSFFGYFEDLEEMAEAAHSAGALLVVATDLTSLGMFRPPSEYDADIVVAEGQAIGVPPTFGGPYVGIFACKQKYVRQMPGRVVGKTVDTRGRDGYVLTLQTREQHIRRERATSNICTAVGLIALMTTLYMSSLGKQGLRRVAELCYHKAHYAASLMEKIPGYSLPLTGAYFREFVVECPRPVAEINNALLERKIIGGLDVSEYVPNGMLVCCTEMNTKEELDRFAEALAEVAKP